MGKMTAAKKAAGMTAKKANGKKMAAAMKKKGVGLFAPKTLSAELAAVCGTKKAPRTEVTKKLWAYIKAKKLNSGKTITPDATLGKVFAKKSLNMLEMPKLLSAHLA